MLGFVAFIESFFFPVPPDLMIVPMVVAKREDYLKIFLIATIFSVLGGLFGYMLGIFFLDMSMPFFAKIANNLKTNNLNANNLAVRFSEYEPIEYALSFKNKAAWIWVDCFNNLPLNEENYDAIRQANFKICIVSPELQNHSEDRIKEFRVLLGDMKIDAVCTKRPELWIG